MAFNFGGGRGLLGVLIGAAIVIVVGGGLLYATGTIGHHEKQNTVTLQLPFIKVK